MPTIPIFSGSPINASKASGVTPQTAKPDGTGTSSVPTKTTESANADQHYPAAQPGARPSLPVQTGAPQPPSHVQPTPTQRAEDVGPPAPQPGAVPVPPGGGTSLPPPPKVGEKLSDMPTQTIQMPMPPQMSYPPPSGSEFSQGRSTTSTIPLPGSQTGYPLPTSLQEAGPTPNLSHPPGYHQDAHASEFTSHQRAAHNANVTQGSMLSGDSEDGGVWDTAKKWASAAGDSLAAAENEVWKRINKD